MQVCEIPLLENYREYFQPEIQKFRQGKHIQIIIIRETKSYTIFTVDGQHLHIERTPAGIKANHPIDRVIMSEHRQLIPEHQTGRGLLRQFSLYPPEESEECEACPDFLLYGYFMALKETDLRQTRIMADSGFLVRDLSQVIRDGHTGKTETDPQMKNLMPEVFIPTVETLVDVTKEEFVYVVSNILKTTRYCPENVSNGFIRNHIVGIYFSDMEVFSNLEMSQSFYDIMNTNGSIPENLTLQDFTNGLVPMANECIKRSVGRITMLTDDEICELLHDINVIYSHQEYLVDFLKSLSQICHNYIHGAKKKGKIQNSLNYFPVLQI